MKLVCVLLLLSLVAVYQTEAGWWGKAIGLVKGAVGKVVGFLGKRDRRRRQLKDDLDASSSRELDAVCQQFHLNELSPDGIPFEMVKVAFEKIDQGGEGVDALNEKEMDLFLSTMEAFEYCLTRGKISG